MPLDHFECFVRVTMFPKTLRTPFFVDRVGRLLVQILLREPTL